MTGNTIGNTLGSGNQKYAISTVGTLAGNISGNNLLNNATAPILLGGAFTGILANNSGVDLRSGVGAALASGTTIAPTNEVHHVTGTAAVVNITAPTGFLGGRLTLVPDAAFTWTAAGNVAVLGTAVVNKSVTFTYDAATSKWYPSYV